MFKIEKIDKTNRQCLIDFLKLDVIRHVFAFYDCQYEPESTTIYAAFENERPKGYILIYTALEFPSVVLECDSSIAEKLVQHAPKSHFIMHASPNLQTIIRNRFPSAKHYIEKWMLLKKGKANLFRSEFVRRLCTNDDSSKLVDLLSTQENRPRRTVNKYVNWISKMLVYGVFVNDKLVSYAGSFIQLPQVWMIGGVYTHPDERNKGYATLATSAITEEALNNVETAALFVRWDNYPAIEIYEKIGYKTIGEKLWVDAGTGLKP